MGLGAGQLLQRDTSAASAAQAAVAPELSDSQLLALFRSIDWNVQEQQGLDKLGAGLAHSELLPEPILDPVQVQANVPRLHALTQHIDADVRAASIQRLATWDKAKQFIAQDVLRIITTDTHHDTQIAATGATSISSLNSDELKRAFFTLLENPSANQELQGVILMQMDRFALSGPVNMKPTKKSRPA